MTDAAFDLLVTGGTLVTSNGVRRASLGVRDGRIAEVLPPDARADAAATLDASGLHILPGVIDTHVHTRHPGVPEREDFLSGTSAAAAGGITTLFEMPISKLPVNSGASLARRAELLQPTALIDYALYGGAGHENLDDVLGSQSRFKRVYQFSTAHAVYGIETARCVRQLLPGRQQPIYHLLRVAM